MSQDLDIVLHSASTAAATCYDLNGNGELPLEEQIVFYQFAEHILVILTQIHGNYDVISVGLANSATAKDEMILVWQMANVGLIEFSRSMTAPKMRAAVSSVAYAIDRSSSTMHKILSG